MPCVSEGGVSWERVLGLNKYNLRLLEHQLALVEGHVDNVTQRDYERGASSHCGNSDTRRLGDRGPHQLPSGYVRLSTPSIDTIEAI